MAKLMKTVTISCVIATIISILLYWKTANNICFSLTITFGTTSYHLLMRLVVGLILNKTMNNHADYNHPWFQLKPFENKFYQKLNVKQWKNKMPTYNPEIFSIKEHSLDEIAQAMCQSEIVHEIIVILSFLPLIASVWFDSFLVFLLTSTAAACFDMMFVIMQRYNRQRILKIINKQLTTHNKSKP